MGPPPAGPTGALRLPLWATLAAFALLALAASLVFHDLSHANRPHELRFVGLVGALALLGLGASLVGLVTGLRVRRRLERRGGLHLLACLLSGLALCHAWLAAMALA